MRLTKEQQVKYLAQYEHKLRGYVYAFCKAYGVLNKHWFEDMLQTAHYVFLKHLDEIQHEKDISRCFLDIKHHLSDEMRSRHVVNIPHNKYPKERHNTHSVPLHETDGIASESFDEDVLTRIAFQDFLDALPENERHAVLRKLTDKPENDELCALLDVDKPWQLTREMNKIRMKFRAYFSDE